MVVEVTVGGGGEMSVCDRGRGETAAAGAEIIETLGLSEESSVVSSVDEMDSP